LRRGDEKLHIVDGLTAGERVDAMLLNVAEVFRQRVADPLLDEGGREDTAEGENKALEKITETNRCRK